MATSAARSGRRPAHIGAVPRQEDPGRPSQDATPDAPAPTPAVGRRWLRTGGRAAIGLGVLALLALAGHYAMHASQHVVSRSAVVKGDLSELGTRFNGVLATIEAPAGSTIEAGQVLARLDDRHLQSEVLQIQAEIEALQNELAVEQAAIALERQRQQARIEEAAARTAAMLAQEQGAQSRAEEARTLFERRRALAAQQFISREDSLEAEARMRTAASLVAEASANTRAARSAEQSTRIESGGIDLREQRIGAVEASIRAAEARLARAEANLDGTVIRAPADGAVLRWLVQPGGAVRVGRPVVSIVTGHDVWVEAWIDEDQIHRVTPGSPVSVALAALPGQTLQGEVAAIGLTTDIEQPTAPAQPRESRLRAAPVVGVQVRLLDPPPSLLPGLSATVSVRDQR